MIMTAPRVSILIPNFNNGRESSRNGQDDLILWLLKSLQETLADDPTPFEILVMDDGSSDDSLATLRAWSTKTWSDGRPFLRLIEAEHCGVLSVVANRLSSEARGDILARLDGDIVCLTTQWVRLLTDAFDRGDEQVGVIGPKQLRPDHRIHAYGDYILHPKGYIHVANGMARDAVRYPLEVDHVMGCFYCCRKTVWEQLDGYDETFLRGQTVDFGLRARHAGWRCLAVPHIEYVHNHVLRHDRSNAADTQDGVTHTLEIFERKWGFSRLAPNLREVERDYEGTPLLWNRNVFPMPQAVDHPDPAKQQVAIDLQKTSWGRYAADADYQQHVNFRVAAAKEVLRQVPQPKQVAILGCGEGLVAHLLAMMGLNVVGVDEKPADLALADMCCSRQTYPGPRPRFVKQTQCSRMPLGDGEADMVFLFDVLECDVNPVGMLEEACRVLADGGILAVVSQRLPQEGRPDPSHPQPAGSVMNDATDKAMNVGNPLGGSSQQVEATAIERRYLWIELVNQINAVAGIEFAANIPDQPGRDHVVIMRKVGEPTPVAV